jgi:signal transduction histidine kinase
LFELYPAIADTISLVKDDLEFHGIAIETVKERDSSINGYKNEFSQVLLNIIVNAKEVLLLRQPLSPRVKIICSQKGDSALVTFKDNGGGIASEILEKIFDPYFTTKFMSQGTGMGLYVSKMIIEKHMSGKISVTSNEEGAEVTIELPLEYRTASGEQPRSY